MDKSVDKFNRNSCPVEGDCEKRYGSKFTGQAGRRVVSREAAAVALSYKRSGEWDILIIYPQPKRREQDIWLGGAGHQLSK